MGTVARLKGGDFLLTGEIDERLPVVTDGLITHYPFDGTLDDNLITEINTSHPHNSVGTEIWNINQSVEGGQVYTVSGYFKRSSLHDGKIFCMFALYRADGSIVCGSGHVPGWSSSVASSEPLYYYFENDIKNFVNDYGFWNRDIAIPDECDGGKIAWIKFVWSNSPITTETTSIKLSSFTFKGHTSYTPITNTATTLTNEGISIEASTTNLLQNPSFETSDTTNFNITTNVGGQITVIQTDAIDGQYAARISCNQGTHNWLSQLYTTSTHGTYTASCWIKLEKYVSGSIGIALYANYSDSTNTSANTFVDNTKIGIWQKVSTTITTDSAKTLSSIRVYAPWSNSLNGSFLGDAVQLEKKDFATAYVNGNRSQNGVLELPQYINSATQSFSVNFWMKPNGMNASDSNRYIKFNNFGWFWPFNPMGGDASNKRYVWDYVASTRSYIDLIHATPFTTSQFEMVTMTWDTNMVTFYRNGVFWRSLAKGATATLGIIDKIIFGNPEITVRDFSIYNKVLSQNEITKLYGTNFQFQSNGNLISDTIRERPNGIPSDTYYYQLSCDTKDEFKYYDASSNSNLVFENSSVWVGGSSINYVKTTMTPNVWNGTLEKQNYLLFGERDVWKAIPNTDTSKGGWSYICDNGTLELSPGQYAATSIWLNRMTASAMPYWYMQGYYYDTATTTWVKQDPIDTKLLFTDVWYDVNGKIYTSNPMTITGDAWYKHVRIVQNNHTDKIRLNSNWFYLTMSGFNSGYCLFSSPQLEAKQFHTPFVVGTRNAGDLEYNLNNSIGLDWNSNWSIIYWVMPVGTANNIDLTGYNISTLGCNSNTVGGGYLWWGKNINNNQIIAQGLTGSIITFNPINYFNKWHMVSLVKNGTVLTVKEYDIEGQTLTFSKDIGSIASNYYVTPYGYDLKLGGWDNTTTVNSFFKDLIVVKRALTDNEMDVIRNTQMRSYKDKLQIQGKLIEGVTLL